MDKKIAIFAFNGTAMVFGHALMQVIDLNDKGIDATLIIEGEATALIPKLGANDNPFSAPYTTAKEKGYISAVCQACAHAMGTLDDAKKQELPIVGDMNGHPAMAKYINEGYEIVSM